MAARRTTTICLLTATGWAATGATDPLQAQAFQQPVFRRRDVVTDTSSPYAASIAGIDPGTNLNFVQDFAVHQGVRRGGAMRQWMLTKGRELFVTPTTGRMTARRRTRAARGSTAGATRATDFTINKPRDDTFFLGASEVVVDDDRSARNDYQLQHRHSQPERARTTSTTW